MRQNSHAVSASEDQMMKFFETSQNLLSLVQHENAIMFKEGLLSFEAYIARKMELMKGFEQQAQNLLTRLSMENSSSKTQLLAEEIKRVKDALQVNSAHQLRSLKKKVASELSGGATMEIEATGSCH